MANTKDTFQVWRSYGTGTGGYRMLEPMNEAELAARAARQKDHQTLLARQEAYENSRLADPHPASTPLIGCVFTKSCNLPDSIIDYHDPTGYVPLDRLEDYGEYALLGGRETDESGVLPLKKISGSALPAGLGMLALAGTVTGSAAAAGAGGVIHIGQRHTTDARAEPDRAHVAGFATDAALDVLRRQAALADDDAEKPGLLGGVAADGASGAGRGAVAAEGAGRSREIRFRIPPLPALQQPGRASLQAVVAASAAFEKISLDGAPRRPKWRRAGRAGTQEATAGKIHFRLVVIARQTDAIPQNGTKP